MAQPGYSNQQQGYANQDQRYAMYPQPGATPGYPQAGATPGYPQPGATPGYPQPGATPGYPQPGATPGYPQPGRNSPYAQGYAQQGYPQQVQPQGFSQYPSSTLEGGSAHNIEDDGDAFAFSDKSVRRGFIRKVYSILALQLLLTCGIIGIFYIDTVREWNYYNPGLMYAASIATFVLIIVLACVPNLRRKAPLNIILLLLFTACEGVVLGSICAYFSEDAVIKAAVTTVLIFVGLTLFAFQTKVDFTLMTGALFTLLWALILFGFMCAIFQNDIMNNVYAGLGAIIFSLYIIVDTQLLMGGKHRYSVSPEEYIFAALNLYLDIVNLFLFLLRIFGNN